MDRSAIPALAPVEEAVASSTDDEMSSLVERLAGWLADVAMSSETERAADAA